MKLGAKIKETKIVDTDELDRAEDMLEEKDYSGTATIADELLLKVPSITDLTSLSRAALLKGKIITLPLVDQLLDENQENPSREMFHGAWDLFQLAVRLDPENEEAHDCIDNMKGIMETTNTSVKHEVNHSEPLDVIIVGAGASGVGVALMLTRIFGLDPERVLLIERGDGVGETFKQWPKEMRFISPSFNQQGWTNSFDLNSIFHGTSPAFTLHGEHPTGAQYAKYLHALAENANLKIRAKTEVISVKPFANGKDGFNVDVVSVDKVNMETLSARYVIWAAGEFQYPRVGGGKKGNDSALFPGAEHCIHNSSVRSWSELSGDDFVIIGGYESGIDAASNLSICGKKCTVVSSTAYWRVTTEDPSTELAPYTADRLRRACASSTPPRLLAPFRVFKVEQVSEEGINPGYIVHAKRGPAVVHSGGEHRIPVLLPNNNSASKKNKPNDEDSTDDDVSRLYTAHPPILCAGFEGSVRLGVAKDLFDWVKMDDDINSDDESSNEECGVDVDDVKVDTVHEEKQDDSKEEDGCALSSPQLNEFDESTKTPGLFLVGPAVRHQDLSFCFIYKFRQRFGVVADTIAQGLGYSTDKAVEDARDMNMYMDDFTCCKSACGETC